MPTADARIAIIGAGALGQQLSQHLRQQHRQVVGFFDDTLPVGEAAGGPVLGSVAAAEACFAAGGFDEVLMGIGYHYLHRRQQLFEALQAAGLPFGRFVHPSAYVDSSVTLGAGVCISPGCVLDLNVALAPNVFLYPGCIIAHDTQVQAHTMLAPGVRLAGRVHVGARCFLGIGTTIIDSLHVGADVRTGGGGVVIRDLPEPGVYAGVQARRLQ